MSFTCPDCGRTSFNPNDEKHRYCGACHKFFPEAPPGFGVVSEDGFVKLDILGSDRLLGGTLDAYAIQHLQMLQIKEQYPGEYEKALEELRCMYAQKNSGPRESWRAKLRHAWRRFTQRM